MEEVVSLESHFWHFIAFNLFVVIMLALDLGVFNRKSHVIQIKEALGWSAFWIALALIFNVFVYFWRGPESSLEFFTGFILEKSLSVDNLFVFTVIFSYFQVPEKYQHKVLFWGVLGALIFRSVFIATGVALIQKFEWVIYIFGGFLILTGLKLGFAGEEQVELDEHKLLRFLKKHLPFTNEYHGEKFFIREAKKYVATPLFLVLVVIETTDVVFAIDSIPAILAISRDPFIVYTSNVFAIMGLRSLYFALAGLVGMFSYLKYGLALILAFVGIKMLIHHYYKVPIVLSLTFIALVLAVSIILSVIKERKAKGL
ncbi:MAG: TerC family protein [Leptospiraceae bacterium]|nr:TerC family protein [Leptospiraceae bacterium]MDW8307680.1 TerC family protein [Leptospiraceae bacterium]